MTASIPRSNLLAVSLLAAVLSACQDTVSQPARPEDSEIPELVLARTSPRTIVHGSDTLRGIDLECRNWDPSTDAEVAGTPVRPDADGRFFLPLPHLGDFCEAELIVKIRTRKATYTDTLRLRGDCPADSDTTIVVPPDTETVAEEADLVFPFDHPGTSQPSRNGKAIAEVHGASWIPSEPTTGGFLRFRTGEGVDFGVLVPDGQSQGSVSLLFRPDAAFLERVASTIFGNDGGRLHIGIVAGQLFFQKNHDNVHRFVASRPGVLSEPRWYSIRASWGSQGMILEVDGTPVAWSNDVTKYQQSPWGEASNRLWSGQKGWCCMEPLRIGSALQLSGDLDEVHLSPTQPAVWNDGFPHACETTGIQTPVPLCGTTSPVRGIDLW